MHARQVIVLILGMSLVTYLPRVLPLIVLSGRRLSGRWNLWLQYVPCAVMAALLSASLQAETGGHNVLGFDMHALLASLPAAVIALKYRSVPATVVIGIASITLLRSVWA